MRTRYFNIDGEPISASEAAELWTEEYARIAKTKVGNFVVSTVWLPHDHSVKQEGPPEIFETEVRENDSDERRIWRYSTKADAIKGHDEIVKLARHAGPMKIFR